MRRASSSVLHAFVLTARLSLTLILILAAFIGITGRAWATPPIANTGVSSTGAGGNGAASAGPALRWIGSIGGATVNTATGNKLTEVPLFGWTARGGLPVGFTFYHNSFSDWTDSTSGFAPKWGFSYQSWVTPDGSGNAVLHWEDGTTFTCVVSGGSTYSPPPGNLNTITYSGTAPATFCYTTKDQISYYFEDQGDHAKYWLKSIKDRNGYTITVNRDPTFKNRITSIVDPTNRTILIHWSGGRIDWVSDPNSRVWSLNYATGSWSALNSIMWPALNGVTRSVVFTYTDTVNQFNIATLQDLKGNVTVYGYTDSSSPNVITSVKDPCLNTTTISYTQTSSQNGSTTVTDPNGHTTTHYYVNGLLDHMTDAKNNTEWYTYDASYNLKTFKDRRGHTWNLSNYDARGNVQTVKDPDLHTISLTYTPQSDVATVQDPLTHTWTYGHDAPGNLTSIHQIVPGTPDTVTDAMGHVTTIGYDANYYPNYVKDASGVEHWAAYNVLGWLTATTDALGNYTSYSYDDWGRVTTITRTGGTQVPATRLEYHTWNDSFVSINTAEVNAALLGGCTDLGVIGYAFTTVSADTGLIPVYRLYKVNVTPGSTDHLMTTSSAEVSSAQAGGYTYEGIAFYVYAGGGPGRLAMYRMVNRATGVHTCTTNATEFNNADPATWGKGGVMGYVPAQAGTATTTVTTATCTYDYNGNLATWKGRDTLTTTYTYDNENRLTNIAHPQTSSAVAKAAIGYGYDAAGRLHTMSDYMGSTTWTYDNANRLTQINCQTEDRLNLLGRKNTGPYPALTTSSYAFPFKGFSPLLSSFRGVLLPGG